MLTLSLSVNDQKQTKKTFLKNLNQTLNNPAADCIISGRLCSTILPWYVLHIDFKVFVCLGLLLTVFTTIRL